MCKHDCCSQLKAISETLNADVGAKFPFLPGLGECRYFTYEREASSMVCWIKILWALSVCFCCKMFIVGDKYTSQDGMQAPYTTTKIPGRIVLTLMKASCSWWIPFVWRNATYLKMLWVGCKKSRLYLTYFMGLQLWQFRIWECAAVR